MKKLPYTVNSGWLLLLLAWIPSGGFTQIPFDPSYREAAGSISDHLELFTDRSLYVAGETIRFRAELFTEGIPADVTWSSVVYTELLAPDGSLVAFSKWRLHEGFAAGSISIPEGVLTGQYLMRSYTRWMRNHGPGSYSYVLLKIINPFNRELAEPTQNVNGAEPERIALPSGYGEAMIECTSEKSVYQPGEWVRLRLRAPSVVQPVEFDGCLTVVPDGSIDTLDVKRHPIHEEHATTKFDIQYLPDLGEAFSLTGIVVSRDGKPAAEASLSFSLLGSDPDLVTAITDPGGRFAVRIPFRKSRQAFLVAPHPVESDTLEVRIDQETDNRRAPVPTGSFRLTGKEREAATLLALRWQIMEAYRLRDTAVQAGQVPLSRTLPFYGSGVERIELDEFVNLPSLEEIFINLVPGINIVRRRGSVMFRVEGLNNSIRFYRPLVMVDYIPVFEHGPLLAMDPRNFQRIEVIREVYVKGRMAFGGVISILTKNGDMAGLDLPQGSYFFDVTPFHERLVADSAIVQSGASQPYPSEEPSTAVLSGRRPDLRNTVLWMEDLHLAPGAQQEIAFRAPGGPGSYVVLVRGAISPGKILSGITRFTVRMP